MKLYRVTLKGMHGKTTSTNYGSPYVVAEDLTLAYQTVREYLDQNDFGFSHEREVDKVELLAETGDYPECRQQLFLAQTCTRYHKTVPLVSVSFLWCTVFSLLSCVDYGEQESDLYNFARPMARGMGKSIGVHATP